MLYSKLHHLKSGWLLTVALTVLAPTSTTVYGQDNRSSYNQGVAAFRQGDHEQAEEFFSDAVKADPSNAQAHYMLARIYTETELEDFSKAGQSLDAAIEADPDNVDYMVAKLDHLRTDASNFIMDRVRDIKRMSLAKQVLEIDPDNGIAHEEMGKSYVRDFWRYRNAISLPTLGLREQLQRRNEPQMDPNATMATGDDPGSNPALMRFPEGQDPDDIFWGPDQYEFRNDDLFNIDRLEMQGIPVQQLKGRANKAYAMAIRHLNKALESDPMRRRVYDYLMQIYALREDYPKAMSMLQDMYTFFPEDARFWFYLGLVHHRTGHNDAAAKAFETGLKYATDNVRFAFENIDLFLSPEERDRYQQNPLVYASRYWTSKDPRYLTPYNERKLEHYSRLVYADLLYGAPRVDMRGWDTQRGQILVRYGPPNSDVVVSGGYEAILTHLMQSRTRRADRGFDNNTPSQEILDFDQITFEANTFAIWDYGDFRFVFEDPFRNNEYRLYSPPADLINEAVDAWENDYVIKAKETFRKTPEQYDYEAPGRQVDFPYLVTTFRGSGDQTDVLVHYGIPVQNYDPDDRELDITVETGTFLVDKEDNVLIERRETLYGLLARQISSFGEDGEDVSLWIDTNTLSGAPGKHDVSVEFETVGGGTVGVQRREVDVPDYRKGETSISDILLAYAVESTETNEPINPGDVVRNGLSISPAPWSVFNTEQRIHLYFELYDLGLNAEGRSSYEVEASLRPKEKKGGFLGIGGSDQGVSVRFEGGGNSAVDNQSLILDASEQEPGLYKLAVKVHDRVRDKTVEKEQDLFLE